MHNTSGTADAPAGRAYDERFKRTLIREILDAIAKTSVLPGSNTVMLRAGETVEALLSTLIAMAAMSPAFDAPETLNQFAETTAKRIRRGSSLRSYCLSAGRSRRRPIWKRRLRRWSS